MKKSGKSVIKFLSMAVLIFFVSASLVSSADTNPQEPPLKESYFKSFSGVVKEIVALPGMENAAFLRKHVIVENQAGSQVYFTISKDTYFIDNDEISVGADVVGIYKDNAPSLMIFPPQYTAEIMAIDKKGRQIKADLFDADLLSADGFLKLNISPETQLVWKDNSPFSGVLGNRKLIVFYTVATRSIPAQTNPSKIIVFEEPSALTNDTVAKMDIIVNDKKIQAPAPYLNKENTVMVPLKPIAEALEFDVAFDEKEQSCVFAGSISFKIGEDNYLYLNKLPIKLGTAPTLDNGEIYLPLNFFTEVVRLNNAYIFENQIVIDNNEKMQ